MLAAFDRTAEVQMKKKRFLLSALLLIVLASEGCATVRGMGEDIHAVSDLPNSTNLTSLIVIMCHSTSLSGGVSITHDNLAELQAATHRKLRESLRSESTVLLTAWIPKTQKASLSQSLSVQPAPRPRDCTWKYPKLGDLLVGLLRKVRKFHTYLRAGGRPE